MTAIIPGVIVGTCTSFVLAALTVAYLTERHIDRHHCGQCEELAGQLHDAHARAAAMETEVARWRGLAAISLDDATQTTVRWREGQG